MKTAGAEGGCVRGRESSESLRRHVASVNKKEPTVVKLSKLSREGPKKVMTLLREKATVTQSVDENEKENPKYESIRRQSSSSAVKHCLNCDGSYSSLTFHRHKKTCKETHHKAISMEFVD